MVICDVSSLGVSSSSGVVWLPALKDRHGSTPHEWASRGLKSSKSTLRVKVGCACGHDLDSRRGLKLKIKAWDEGSPGDSHSHARWMLLRKLRRPGQIRRTEDRRHGRGKIYEADYKHGGDSWINYKAKLRARSWDIATLMYEIVCHSDSDQSRYSESIH